MKVKLIYIVIFVLVVLLGSSVFYFLGRPRKTTKTQTKPKTTKTYRDTNGQYTIQYPKDWYVIADANKASIQDKPEKILFGGGFAPQDKTGWSLEGRAVVIYIEESGGLNLKDWIRKRHPVITKEEEIEVDGVKGQKIIFDQELGAGMPHVYLPKANRIYVVSFNSTYGTSDENGLKVFDGVVRDFRFE